MDTSHMLTAAILLSLTTAQPAQAQFFAADTCTETFEKNGWTIQAWRERWEVSAIRQITLPKGMKTLRGKSKMNVRFIADYEETRDGPYLRNITVRVPDVKLGGKIINWGKARSDGKGFVYEAALGAEVGYGGKFEYLRPYYPAISGVANITSFALLSVDDPGRDRTERYRIQQNFVDGGGVRLLIMDTVTQPAGYAASSADLEDSALLTIEDLVANIDNVKADMTAASAQLRSSCDG